MASEMPCGVDYTARGFELIQFADYYGAKCSLQQSSRVEPAVWLGCSEIPPMHLGMQPSPRMHLDRGQVVWLVARLQAWLETGSFEFAEWQALPWYRRWWYWLVSL